MKMTDSYRQQIHNRVGYNLQSRDAYPINQQPSKVAFTVRRRLNCNKNCLEEYRRRQEKSFELLIPQVPSSVWCPDGGCDHRLPSRLNTPWLFATEAKNDQLMIARGKKQTGLIGLIAIYTLLGTSEINLKMSVESPYQLRLMTSLVTNVQSELQVLENIVIFTAPHCSSRGLNLSCMGKKSKRGNSRTPIQRQVVYKSRSLDFTTVYDV